MARPTKEQAYLKENPSATPYDMVLAGVIDQKRADELDAQGTQTAQEFAGEQPKTQTAAEFAHAQNAAKPTQTASEFAASNKLIPKTVTTRTKPHTERIIPNTSGNVTVTNRKTGRSAEYSRKRGEKLVNQYPQTYILS